MTDAGALARMNTASRETSRRASVRYAETASERHSNFGTVVEDDEPVRTDWIWLSPVQPHDREEDVTKLLVRCGKVRQVVLPTNGDQTNKGYAYVQFHSEAAVSAAMQLRPSQICNKTIKRFKKASNPHVKRMLTRPYSFSNQGTDSEGNKRPDIASSHPLAISGRHDDAEASKQGSSNEGAPLSAAYSNASTASIRQSIAASRLSAGLSTVEMEQRGRTTADQETLHTTGDKTAGASGSLRRSAGQTASMHRGSKGVLYPVQSSTRRTTDDPVSCPATVNVGDMSTVPEAGSAVAPAGSQAVSAPFDPEASSKTNTIADDKPIATLQPDSEQPPSELVSSSSKPKKSKQPGCTGCTGCAIQ